MDEWYVSQLMRHILRYRYIYIANVIYHPTGKNLPVPDTHRIGVNRYTLKRSCFHDDSSLIHTQEQNRPVIDL